MLALILLAALAADPEPGDAEVAKLHKERVATMRDLLKKMRGAYLAKSVTLHRVAEVGEWLLQTELDAATKAADRVAAHQNYLKLMVELHVRCQQKFEVGTIQFTEVARAKAARLKAEIDLRKAGGKPPAELAWPAMPMLDGKD